MKVNKKASVTFTKNNIKVIKHNNKIYEFV